MSETVELRRRRMAVVRLLDGVIYRITEMIEHRMLMPGETSGNEGVQLSPTYFESWEVRETRLRRFVTNLRDFRTRLSSAPVPANWSRMDSVQTQSLLVNYTASYYFHFADEMRFNQTDTLINSLYFESLGESQQSRRPTPTGIYITVSDPEQNPQAYVRLDQSTSYFQSTEGPVLEIMHDGQRGYFYMFQGTRQYLQSAP